VHDCWATQGHCLRFYSIVWCSCPYEVHGCWASQGHCSTSLHCVMLLSLWTWGACWASQGHCLRSTFTSQPHKVDFYGSDLELDSFYRNCAKEWNRKPLTLHLEKENHHEQKMKERLIENDD
jgi:hypothetical protein